MDSLNQRLHYLKQKYTEPYPPDVRLEIKKITISLRGIDDNLMTVDYKCAQAPIFHYETNAQPATTREAKTVPPSILTRKVARVCQSCIK